MDVTLDGFFSSERYVLIPYPFSLRYVPLLLISPSSLHDVLSIVYAGTIFFFTLPASCSIQSLVWLWLIFRSRRGTAARELLI